MRFLLAQDTEQFEQLISELPLFDQDRAQAWAELAWKKVQAGHTESAAVCFQRVVQLDPTHVEAWANLGSILRNSRLPDSVQCYERAVELEPSNVRLIRALIKSLREARQYDSAWVQLERLRQLEPRNPEDALLRANLLQELGRFDEALRSLSNLHLDQPRNPQILNCLGIAHHRIGSIAEAIRCFRFALQLAPTWQDVRFHLAMSLLLLEQYEEGWNEFEHRPGGRFCQRSKRSWAVWNGQSLMGKTLILAAEQGLGDTIQAVRFANEIKRRFNGNILLQCPPRLIPLMSQVRGIDSLIPRNQPLPPFDYFVPLMSLPSILNYRPNQLSAGVPYLATAPERLCRCAEVLSKRIGSSAANVLRVGINWQGDPTFAADSVRSVPLQAFSVLAEIPGVKLISLQHGQGTEQIAKFQRCHPLLTWPCELDSDCGAFEDTAALMQNLDLVITTDTAIAHVAGALDIRTWLALGHVPDWRWQLSGESSPWYPSMRLFRQPTHGDWSSVFRNMASELSKVIHNR